MRRAGGPNGNEATFLIYEAKHAILAERGDKIIHINDEGKAFSHQLSFRMEPTPYCDEDGLFYVDENNRLQYFVFGGQLGASFIVQSFPENATATDIQEATDSDRIGVIAFRESERYKDKYRIYWGGVEIPLDDRISHVMSLGDIHYKSLTKIDGKKMKGEHTLLLLTEDNGQSPPKYFLKAISQFSPVVHHYHGKDRHEFQQTMYTSQKTSSEMYGLLKKKFLSGGEVVSSSELKIPLGTDSRYTGFVKPRSFMTPNLEDNHQIPVHFWSSENAEGKLIIHIHGGPDAYEDPLFNAGFQYWVGQNFSVASLEPRGSDGYGRQHRNSHVGDWGGKDISDIMAVATYFKSQNYPSIFLAGCSYGGYATLKAITDPKYATFFKGAVPIMGIYDFKQAALKQTQNLNATLRYSNCSSFELVHEVWKGKHYWKGRLGFDPETDEENNAKASITDHLDRLSIPTLLIHGVNDTNCFVDEAEAVYSKSPRGKPHGILST